MTTQKLLQPQAIGNQQHTKGDILCQKHYFSLFLLHSALSLQ